MDKRVQRKFIVNCWCYLIRIVYTCLPYTVKINAGRTVTGVLRGFDPYMNIVLDDAVEEMSNNKREPIGMIVSCYGCQQSVKCMFVLCQCQLSTLYWPMMYLLKHVLTEERFILCD